MKFDGETLLSLLILASFAWMMWRGGSRNPVGTGSLQKQLNQIGSDVRQLKTTAAGGATKEEVTKLRGELEELEKRTASSAEIVALQGDVKVLHTKIDANSRAADRTEEAVQRIEGLFLQRGVGK